jgi:cleavage stimulation factor subunit 3
MTGHDPLPLPYSEEKEEEKPRQVSIPPVILLFVGDLPVASSLALTGPVFRTDDPWN